jgi:hypothetical protein
MLGWPGISWMIRKSTPLLAQRVPTPNSAHGSYLNQL